MFDRIPDSEDAIGGYLSLEAPARVPDHLQAATTFQSGRAAFLALLQTWRPTRVHLPWFLCDSMHEPLRQSGIDAVRYAIDATLGVVAPLDVGPNDLVLVVNYFGLCGDQVRKTLAVLPARQVVVDNAHAFFEAPSPALATLFSPRKFIGVPDGGFLHAPGLNIPRPPPDEISSLHRSTHLIKRVQAGAEAGYADYTQAEQTLDNQPARGISRLSMSLLAAADLTSIRQRRQRNFRWLHERLAPFNELTWRASTEEVPLCYPLLPRRSGSLREALAAARVYVPRYWPDLLRSGDKLPSWERRLVKDLLPLPIDQRYDTAALDRYMVAPLVEALRA